MGATFDVAAIGPGAMGSAAMAHLAARRVKAAGFDAYYPAAKIIISTGSWIGELVPDLAAHAVPFKQVVSWYQPKDGFVTQQQRMPVFIRDAGENGSFFGFPVIGPDGVKVGRHAHFREQIDPNAPNPPVNDRDGKGLGCAAGASGKAGRSVWRRSAPPFPGTANC